MANVDERIDFIFVVPPPPGSTCSGAIEAAGDPDADGTTTRIFADDPNPFAACGPAPAAVCWPSDHEGNDLDLGGVCTPPPVPSASLPGLLALALATAARRASTRLWSAGEQDRASTRLGSAGEQERPREGT